MYTRVGQSHGVWTYSRGERWYNGSFGDERFKESNSPPNPPTLSQQPGHSLKSYILGVSLRRSLSPVQDHINYISPILHVLIDHRIYNSIYFFQSEKLLLFFCPLSLSLSPLSSRILLGDNSCSTQLGKLPYTSAPYNLFTANQLPLPVSPIFRNRPVPAL